MKRIVLLAGMCIAHPTSATPPIGDSPSQSRMPAGYEMLPVQLKYDDGYNLIDGQPGFCYVPMTSSMFPHCKLLEDTESDTFEVINHLFARDGDRLYLMAENTGLDFVGVSFISGRHVVHRGTVYGVHMEYGPSSLGGLGDLARQMEHALPQLEASGLTLEGLHRLELENQLSHRYRLLKDSYVIGDDTVYWRPAFRRVSFFHRPDAAFVDEDMRMQADPSSFAVMSQGYAIDDMSVYYHKDAIADSDPVTFRFLDIYGAMKYARDSRNIYYDGARLTSDTGHFEILSAGFSRDAETVFIRAVPISGRDAQSFEVIGMATAQRNQVYTRDRNGVYFGDTFSAGTRIPGVDPTTFELLSGQENAYARDRWSVYLLGKKIEGVNPRTFVVPGVE